MNGAELDFQGVRLVEHDPRAAIDPSKRRWKDAAALWGCGFISFILIMIFLAGLYQIRAWMK